MTKVLEEFLKQKDTRHEGAWMEVLLRHYVCTDDHARYEELLRIMGLFEEFLSKENAVLKARIEFLETPHCQGCGARLDQSCRRHPDKACFREFHGGSRMAKEMP